MGDRYRLPSAVVGTMRRAWDTALHWESETFPLKDMLDFGMAAEFQELKGNNAECLHSPYPDSSQFRHMLSTQRNIHKCLAMNTTVSFTEV